ncbi:MAG: YiiG family protein [Myxococcales bacterium]|nr:YiiG family protein [Myxococcales bacterium]
MRNTSYAMAIAIALLSTQLGCKKLAQTGARLLDAGGETASKEAASVDEDEALNGLVDCLNGLDHAISKSLERYTSWLPDAKEGAPQPGPTGKESSVWGLYKITDHEMTTCDKGLKLASAKPEFKDTSEKFKAVADKIVPVINEANTYYDRKDFKDDKFAKGKELHTRLWPLAEEFFKVSHDFRAIVVKANDVRMEAELKEVEAQHGRNLLFHKLNVLKHAKASVRVATEEKAPLIELEPLMVAYEKAVEEMKTYASSHKDETGKVMMWSMFESKVEDYLKVLKERVRRVRDKKAYTSSEIRMLESGSGWMVEGSTAKVSRDYNDLVSRSNSLRF